MLSQELYSMEGDIPRENCMGTNLPAPLILLDASGATDTRKPLAELTVPSGVDVQRVEQGHSAIKKQLLTKNEREAMRLEKERAKEEARLKKETERQKKEQERKEKKEAMERERLEKKEQEREYKERKEAERRKKEEEKEAEKNLKVELKKQQELEKEKANEEKLRKQQIAKERFLGFFRKVEPSPSTKQESSVQLALFTPFMAKPNMVLAKRPRPQLQDTVTFDSLLESQLSPSDYLATCRLKQKAKPSTGTTPTSCSLPTDDVIIISLSSGGSSSPPGGVSGVQKRKYKLLQFHDNYRPAFYGTWSSISNVVGPRNPFKLDKEVLNYDVDSDEEWEEEEPGENISHSENEQESGEEEDGDNDGFFVPHGYLSEGEGQSSEEEEEEGESGDGAKIEEAKDPANCGAMQDKHKERQQAKAKAWEAKCTNTYQPIRPLKIGCVWLDAITPEQPLMSREEQLLRQFTAVTLTELPIVVETVVAVHTTGEGDLTPRVYTGSHNISLGRILAAKCIFMCHARSHQPGPQEPNGPEPPQLHVPRPLGHQALQTPPPPSAIRVARGLGRMTLDVSRTPDTNLIEEASGISKRQLTMKITGMAIKEQRPPSNRPLWYVHEPVFRQYNLDPQRVTSLVPLLPDKPPVMSPDDHQNGKRPPKRATNGTPTIRDLWSRPHPCHRASGKTVGSALTQEDDAPIAKRPCLDKEEVITIDSEPSPDGEGDGEGDGGAQEDEVAARFVAGGVAGVGLCASAVFKQDSLLQGAEPMVETFVLVEDEPHLRSE
eukprot:Em0009g923a